MNIAPKGILAPSERERILRSAAELCAERGFEELTVEAIVARAATSTRTFHKLFSGVEDCVIASVSALTAQVLAEVSGTYLPDRSEWDSGIIGMKAILELMAAHPSFAYLGYVVARQTSPPRIREVYRGATQMLTIMVERLWDYSELEHQPRLAARGALGGCEALVRREVVAGRGEQLPRILPELIYIATVPFLGQEEAMRLSRRGRELLVGSSWEA
jgi:AcrR family transcriptional regulator